MKQQVMHASFDSEACGCWGGGGVGPKLEAGEAVGPQADSDSAMDKCKGEGKGKGHIIDIEATRIREWLGIEDLFRKFKKQWIVLKMIDGCERRIIYNEEGGMELDST